MTHIQRLRWKIKCNIENFEHLVVESFIFKSFECSYWLLHLKIYTSQRHLYYVYFLFIYVRKIDRAYTIKTLNRRNQNASIAVPDCRPDRWLIIDLDINQNVRHTFLFPLCRVRIYYLRRNNHLSSRFIVLYDCVLVIFLFREMLLLFASYPPPPRHHDCMLQYAARL